MNFFNYIKYLPMIIVFISKIDEIIEKSPCGKVSKKELKDTLVGLVDVASIILDDKLIK